MQIEEVVESLQSIEIEEGIKFDRIISSPLIRCIQTADLVAKGLDIDMISVEYGLMEEAKSFRGHPPNEPAPVWDPLVLSVDELRPFSRRVGLEKDRYRTMTVDHTLDFSCTKNGVRELHQLDPSIQDPVQVTSTRCLKLIEHLEDQLDDDPSMQNVLLVSHYAIVKGIASQLHEGGLGGHMKVGSFGGFLRKDVRKRTASSEGAMTGEENLYLNTESKENLQKRWAPISPQWTSTKRVPPRPR